MKTQKDSKTLIFDEVDAGIGGKVAAIVGKNLKAISQQQQVICVTHLPQIASCADHHIRVTKKLDQRRTVVHVSILNQEEKIREIARMLAGEKISETSLRHAKEMVKSNGRRHLEY
jgi:DNA repair protein RecN (Recombination protein N)